LRRPRIEDSPLVGRREALRRAALAAGGWWCAGRLARAAPPAPPATAREVAVREEIELSNRRMKLVVAPGDGAGLLAWKVWRGNAWLDLYPDVRDPGLKMRYASWMMIPYSNRIENGVFVFEGREHRLRNGANHAIHGDARSRPWTVAERGDARLRLSLRTADFADFNWPWPMEIAAEIVLDEDALTQRLRIVNRGDSTMPAGFGWHPYYRRSLTAAGEPVLVRARLGGVWPDPDGDCLPNGPLEPLPPDLDFSSPRPVAPDRRYDVCLGGWDGRAEIEWPDSGVKLGYECSANCVNLVYFNPTDRPVFALEPAANANNGINLMARGWAGHGVIALPAGEAVEAEFRTRVAL